MTLYGVLAQSEKARIALRLRKVHALARSFPRDEKAWWIDSQGRVALFKATVLGTDAGPVVFAFDSTGRLNDKRVTRRASGTASRSYQDAYQRGPAFDGDLTSLIQQAYLKTCDSLTEINGEFALACWDTFRGRLILARDHFGQRQLYVHHREGFSLFCSELGPMLEDPAWSREMDYESAIHYLARGLPLRGRTLAKGIESIPAAHLLQWEPPRRPLLERYWTPLSPHSPYITRKQLADNVTVALNEAIFSRLAPRNNALLLSGGVDSSYIAVAAVKKIPARQMRAYTIEYEPGYNRNEGNFAASVAHSVGAQQVLVSLEPKQAYSLLQEILASPVPCSAWTSITHKRLLAEVSDRKEKVLLSGLGADEIFGGYDSYLDYYFRQRNYARRWRHADKIDWFDSLLANKREASLNLFPGIASFFGDERLRRALFQPFARIELDDFDRNFYRECRRLKPDAHVFEMMVAYECQHRIPDLLMSNFEPLARAVNVSTSYPFLDPTLVNWASLLGPSDRYWYEHGYWWAKKLYREVAATLLPQAIVMRRRATYDAPIAEWLGEPEFGPATLDRFASSRFWQVGLLRRSLRDELLKRARKPLANSHSGRKWLDEFWIVLTLSAWFDRFIEGI